jgi:hypothetical protein
VRAYDPPVAVRLQVCRRLETATGARRAGSTRPTSTGIGVTWLYGFKLELKVVAKLPE